MRNSQNPSDTMGLVLGCMSPVFLFLFIFVVLVLLHHAPALLAVLFVVSWCYCAFRLIRWIVTS